MSHAISAIGPLAWTQFWQVTVVALGVGLLVGLFGRRRPHLAHVLWLVVLIKCVTPPVWSSPAGIFSWAGMQPVASISTAAKTPHDARIAPRAHDAETVAGDTFEPQLAADSGGSPTAIAPRDVVWGSDPGSSWFSIRAKTVLACVWLAGVVFFATIVLTATVGCLQKLRSRDLAMADRLTPLTVDLRRRLGIRWPVRLVVTRAVIGPLTFGWLRPTVVMPQALVAVRSPDELEPLLAHELVHVRRGDAWVGLVQVVVQCLWWFHPLVWWANRQIARQRERCCDEAVVAGLHYQPGRYARSLLSVLELKGQLRWLAGLPGVRTFEITQRRLEYVMVHSARFHPRMPRRYWLILAAGLLVLLPGAGLSAHRGMAAPPADDSPATPSKVDAAEEQPAAAEIVQELYDGQAWVERTRTFRIRTTSKGITTPEERRWREDHPIRGPFFRPAKPDARPPDNRPYCTDVDWAWDETRVFKSTRSYYEGDAATQSMTWIWDGSLGVEMIEGADHDQYVLSDKIDTFFNERSVARMAALPWGLGGPYRFWWLPIDVDAYREERGHAPNGFELVGREMLDGRDCHVAQSRVGQYHRMHVGVADGRLYQLTRLAAHPSTPGYDNLAIWKKIGGPAIQNGSDWQTWYKNLEPAEQMRAWRDVKMAQFEFARPTMVQKFDDYREVAPGCWLPFRQTYDGFNVESPESFHSSHSEQFVTDVAVNEPPDDELFRIELKDGVYVATDWRYDPIIRYTYRKDQTEQQRQALCETARQQQAETDEDMKRRRAVIESRIGQTPPPLPKTGWLDGEPLSWDQLRGKVVVLHFWDVNCGPCDNELPLLAGWHDNAANNGLVVIGIHSPTDDPAAVRKKLADFDATYPVLIDSPPEHNGGLGLLHDWFGNSWWPHIVLIDKTGRVGGHGQLWLGDVNEQIRKLSAARD